jgi:hypothetical protein
MGCDFCADSDNRHFGHMDQVLGDDGGVALLRCPLCQVIYLPPDDGSEVFARLTRQQALAILPESQWHVVPGRVIARHQRLDPVVIAGTVGA